MLHRPAVANYAVIWTAAGDEAKPVAGRLEVTDRGIILLGGSRSAERRLTIPRPEILSVRRTRESIGPLPAIALDAASVGTILIATVAGVGCRSEILELLQRLAAAAQA